MRNYDGEDWWWRCEFKVQKAGRHTLTSGGVATYAELLVDEEAVIDTCNMFVGHRIVLNLGKGPHTLLVHCRSLQPILDRRHPRPRWESPDLEHQNLRWIRTSLLGRQVGGVPTPAPVGPWRPLTLRRSDAVDVRTTRLRADCAVDGSGTVEVTAELTGFSHAIPIEIRVGDITAPCQVTRQRGVVTLRARVHLPRVERWWPHTHGRQPLYDVTVEAGDLQLTVARVGFRTISVDRTEGAFTLLVNDIPIFARGVCWSPTDPISLQDGPLRQHLETLARRRTQHRPDPWPPGSIRAMTSSTCATNSAC
jgi:hypothetical protein